ncbi:bifunctional phosphopantothenoylcysteine decarboxylase/phosphopantothenate--cysteine ligase CoaBC [Chthonobacter rhizosphaerae]|uniref:bifunctional phosphopantothenoylcysteine decarboxylase/phosphopantothenate--cysteine ligase CoaBC n=1 Tax=Chthonobacter rhizosphaerae TaxID=2735553 RepID=UPI0015EEE0E4|nr:bifunctional phosphopantothenoylcysteine decarboxylase/phosphopantothenate--cysteine ligase CoaBC [Chthonobacter rhizosphaerae]
MLASKRILLVIGGGIAAYKVLDLIRRLKERGASVRAILTRAGAEFVTPLAVGALTETRVHTDLFDLTEEQEIGHIRLSREADLVLVAPATADLMAKMANGLANDLASTCLLATTAPVMVCPAMNPRMWSHPATRRNAETLKRDGVVVIEPASGRMAERGEEGVGRLPEPLEIVAAVERFFAGAGGGALLAGRRVIVTSGPTLEPIDPVRYIANRSSGRQGHAIAAAAARAGASVTLVSGPVAIPDPPGVTVVKVETARQMLAAVEQALPADVAVMAAAVADWRVATETSSKIKKDGSGRPPVLDLAENPDILKAIGQLGFGRPAVVVGFAAETDDVEANGRAKLARKGADLIVANDVSPETGVMGGTRNTVHVISADGAEHWPTLTKDEVAERLVRVIAARLGAAP